MTVDVLNHDDILSSMEWYQRHPVEWVRDFLGIELCDYQVEIIEALVDNRIVAVKSCHSAGKSFVASCAVLWFLFCHPDSKVITTGPTSRQVKGILWSEIATLHRKAIRPLGGTVTTTEIKIDTNWYAWGFTAKETDDSRFQGFHAPHILVVIDEAAGVANMIHEQVESIMSGAHPRKLMIGNPTNEHGEFGDAFKDTDVCKITVSAFDTPNFLQYGITIEDIRNDTWKDKVTGPYPFKSLVTPEMARRFWKLWGEGSPQWDGRMMARFPVISDDSLVPLAWIEAAHQRWLEIEEANGWKGDGILGVDVARYGVDRTVAAESYGAGVRELHKAPKQSTTETAGWIGQLLKEDDNLTEVRIDADGLGAGVFDMVEEEQPDKSVRSMRGGTRAMDDDRFLNARAEWFWNLRCELDPAGDNPIALPLDDDLQKQLVRIHWKTTRKGVIQIESKDDMRKRGLSSPDEADATAYARARLSGSVLTVDPSAGYTRNPYSDA